LWPSPWADTFRSHDLPAPVTLDPAVAGYTEALARIQQIMNPAPAPPAPGFAERLATAMAPAPAALPMSDAATGGVSTPGAPGAPGRRLRVGGRPGGYAGLVRLG
jgi:hypothetical protein